MYKIPTGFKSDILKGELISQITFGLNFIMFFFDKGYIQLSGKFSVDFGNEKFYYEEVYPVTNDFGFLRLLEKSIIGTDIDANRNILTLVFEDAVTLHLIGNSEYESYKVKVNEEEFVV